MTRRLIRASGVWGHEGSDTLLINDGVIAAIGRWDHLTAPGIGVVDHESGVIVPILHDHHFHPIGYAATVTGLSLKKTIDFDDLLATLRAHADLLEPGQALVGNRLDEEEMTERRLPTRIDLDRAVPERPVRPERTHGRPCSGCDAGGTASRSRALTR